MNGKAKGRADNYVNAALRTLLASRTQLKVNNNQHPNKHVKLKQGRGLLTYPHNAAAF